MKVIYYTLKGICLVDSSREHKSAKDFTKNFTSFSFLFSKTPQHLWLWLLLSHSLSPSPYLYPACSRGIAKSIDEAKLPIGNRQLAIDNRQLTAEAARAVSVHRWGRGERGSWSWRGRLRWRRLLEYAMRPSMHTECHLEGQRMWHLLTGKYTCRAYAYTTSPHPAPFGHASCWACFVK